MSIVHRSALRSLPLVASGKVRDIYAVGDRRLLIVTSDRLSAFDVVMQEPIPGKGRVLNAMALHWFGLLDDIVPNHLTGVDPAQVVAPEERDVVSGRSMVVRRLKPVLVEAVVRGYLAGSGWAEYRQTGKVCGIALPAGLRQAERLREPIFTPAAKAAMGEHDENISFDAMCDAVGTELADRIRGISLALYRRAVEYAEPRGLLLADTKFEFGVDTDGTLRLMDEVLTPDSSRFWPADLYRVGMSPPSFDKQFVRDYLESVPGWDKRPPPPPLPTEVIEATAARYQEAYRRLVDDDGIQPVRGEALTVSLAGPGVGTGTGPGVGMGVTMGVGTAASASPSTAKPPAPAPATLPGQASSARHGPFAARTRVGVVMGSSSDWETMRHAVDILEELGVEHEASVVSAHRMPDEMFDYAESASDRGLAAIVAGAGGAAHLPGMLAAKTCVPVLGVPVPTAHLGGRDSLLSIVQMPRGVPVATFAIGKAGAANAALFAVAMLAVNDPALAQRLQRWRERQSDAARAMQVPPAPDVTAEPQA